MIHNTIYILLEEWDAAINIKYQKRMLDSITCKCDNINFKGSNKGSYDSYTNFMCVWNTYGLKIVENDRRIWALENCAEERPSSFYFNKLYAFTDDPQVRRALYDYLLRVDLTDFNPCQSRTSLHFTHIYYCNKHTVYFMSFRYLSTYVNYLNMI